MATEKEKRKPQPRKRQWLYVGLVFLGCILCLSCSMFWALSQECTWNRWSRPRIPVPESSMFISEEIGTIGGYHWMDTTLFYTDSELSEEALRLYFSGDSSCIRCNGTAFFWGTEAHYTVDIQPTDEHRLTVYSIQIDWEVCPQKWED